MSFELNDVDEIEAKEEEGRWVSVVNPKTGTAARFKVVGSYSKTYREAAEEFARKSAVPGISEEEQDQAHVEMLARCVLDFEGITKGGQALAFSRRAAVEVLSRAIFREAIGVAVRKHDAFFAVSSPAS